MAFLVLVNALILRVGDPPALARLRDLAFDGFQRLHPREVPPDLPVRIVDIDEASLAEYGQWPWPRNIVAKLVDKLAEKGAAAIAFDVVFAEPDRSSLLRVVQSLPPSDQTGELKQLAAKFPDNDEVLAESIKNAPVVTGFGFDLNGSPKPPRRFAGLAHNTGEAKEANVASLIATFIPEQAGAVRTLDMFEKVAKGNGSVTTEIEGAIVRRVPLLFRMKGQRDEDLFPALSLEALRVAQGASTYLVRWAGAQGLESFGARTGMSNVRVGNFNIDTDAEGRIELYDFGPSDAALRLGEGRAERHAAGRQDRRPHHPDRHLRRRPEGPAKHAAAGFDPRRRGPRPDPRAGAEPDLPRTAGLCRRRGVPLPCWRSAWCS